MKHLRSIIWLILFALVVVPVVAAVDCPEVVSQALSATDELCEATGRNQACYGHVRLDAQPQQGADDFVFEQAGDRVDVAALQSLRLSPMEVETGAWGVALMRLQASLPTTGHSDITLLMFGDVQIENAVQTPPVELDVTVSVDEYINVRRGPTTRAGVVGVLAPGQTARALERLESGAWLRVELPRTGAIGWLDASLVTSAGDLTTLSVSEPWTPRYRPMQAFYFESGTNDPGCPEAPTSGMLIQTPEGVGEVTLLINEVNVRIGSTAFFQAQPGKTMRISTVEGAVEVEAMGVTHTAVAGSEISVPMDSHNEPSAPPSRPRPYDQAEWETLPVDSLAEEISDIPDPLSQAEIAAVVSSDAEATPSGEPSESSPGEEASPTPEATGSLTVNSTCAGIWVVRNTTAYDVTFTWDAVDGASGGGLVPAGGEIEFETASGIEAVSITFDVGGGPQSAGASASSRSCGGDAPPATPTDAEPPTSEPAPPTNEPPPPPTDEPTLQPTDVPPTIAPTDVPPTDVPPTVEPPTSEPPTNEPPPPPTNEPPPPDPPTEPTDES